MIACGFLREDGRRLRYEFAVGVHGTRLAGDHLEARAPRGADLADSAMSAGHEGREHEGHPPRARELEGIEVERAVIDSGVCHDDVTAAVITAVADRDLQGAHHDLAFADQKRRVERRRLRQQVCRRHGVAQAPEASFARAGQMPGEIGRETNARDVEERITVDVADVDTMREALGDHPHGRLEILGHADRSREIVGGAERNHPQRKSRRDEAQPGRVQRAVAAADDDAIDRIAMREDAGRKVLAPRAAGFGEVETMRGKKASCRRKRRGPMPACPVYGQESLSPRGLHCVFLCPLGLNTRDRRRKRGGWSARPTKESRHGFEDRRPAALACRSAASYGRAAREARWHRY